MPAEKSFVPLLIVATLAFVVPLLLSRLRRLRLPIVVGEILAGIAIGRSGFGLVHPDDPSVVLLGELGFVFLMFLSGMEVDFSKIAVRGAGGFSERRVARPLNLALLSFAAALVLALVFGFILTEWGLATEPLMMGLILSTTSLGVVVPVLKESGLSSSRYGQTLLLAALVADLATMILITAETAVLAREGTPAVLFVGYLFLGFVLAWRFGVAFKRIPAARRLLQELSHATAQIKIRAALLLMLLFVVLSEKLGTEVILGAFLAGVIVSLLRTPDDAEARHQLESIGFGFIIPIFFIKVGIDFDFSALADSPRAALLVPVLVLAAVLVKFSSALVFRLVYPWRETLAAAALLSARLSLIIAASAVGLKLGAITPETNAAIVLVAVLTVTFAPLTFTRLMRGAADHGPRSIVVVGAGQLGLQVAEHLRAHHETVVVIDSDPGRVEEARARRFTAVVADVAGDMSAAEPHFRRAKAVACTYGDNETNYRVCQAARADFGISHVVVDVHDPAELARFQELGATIVNAAFDRGAWFALLARNPMVYELLSRVDDDKEVREVVLRQPILAGQPLRSIQFPGDVLVVAIRRDGELIMAHGGSILQAEDRLILAGAAEAVEAAEDQLS